MSLWHADASAQVLGSGARILVHSPHRVVRVTTADQISIETPSGDRLSALVLDRTKEELTLSFLEGAPIHLSMVSDDSLAVSAAGREFSRQLWVVS